MCLKTYWVFALIFILKTLLMGTCMICVYKTLLLMPTCTTGRYFYFECFSSAWFVHFKKEICWILNSYLLLEQFGTTDPSSCCCVCLVFSLRSNLMHFFWGSFYELTKSDPSFSEVVSLVDTGI